MSVSINSNLKVDIGIRKHVQKYYGKVFSAIRKTSRRVQNQISNTKPTFKSNSLTLQETYIEKKSSIFKFSIVMTIFDTAIVASALRHTNCS